jgi:archaellum component FlaD/FlaE
MSEEFSPGLDDGESLRTQKEVEEMTEKVGEEPEKSDADAEKKEEAPKKEQKKSVKKASKPAPKRKKSSNGKKKKNNDADFDEEVSPVIYAIWAAIGVAVVLLLIWLLTDWKVCIQF